MTLQHRSPTLLLTLAAMLVASCFGSAQAAPTAPLVVQGQATFSQNGNVFSITNTPNAVINWQSFSVNAGEVTRFIQQSGDSAVLNRIVGQDPSRILGALESNGHVFLINPNGILFGRDSRIDVNGLTASTLGMTDADFLAGKKRFDGDALAGAIVNQGSITTPSGGQVFLIASNVDNAGIITSPQGQVVLAAGHSVQLVDSANPSLHVVVSAPASGAVNLGQIIAQGGKVGIYGALVSQRGVVNANSAQVGENGKIVLRAGGDAMLEPGSVTTATGAGRGGDVTVEGMRVALRGDARIDASGATGGGSVMLGGGYQGKNPLIKNAQQTLLGKNASVRADAIDSGNGGTVVLWSEASTRASGQISARGGTASGNGGTVETSGKFLDVNGISVQAGAQAGVQNGANGVWLLDPFDIEVTDARAKSALLDIDQFADPGTLAQIDASTISAVAPGTNVVLQATHDIKFSQPINPMLGGGSLTLDAGNSIVINAAINTNGGSVKMTVNHPDYAGKTGAIQLGTGGSLTTGGGSVNLNGFQVMLDGPVNTGNGNVTINAASLVGFNQNIATGNGHLTVTGSDIAFGGTGTSASGGFMLFNTMGGAFTLGPNWMLGSNNAVVVNADTMSLLGAIGPYQATRPVVSLSTYTPGRPIDLISGGTGAALAIDPAALARFDAASINIGHQGYAGNIGVQSEYSNGKTNKLVFQTQGNIAVNAPVTMPSGVDSALLLLVEGANHKSSITTAADGKLARGGALAADHIELRANNIGIGASIMGTGGNGEVALNPHMPTGQIMIGVGAVDGFDMLGLFDTELAFIKTRILAIGGNAGQMGGLTVTAGGMDFSSSLPAGSKLMLNGGLGNVQLNGKLVTIGDLFLQGNDLQTAAGASAKADLVRMKASFGIGGNTTPFVTETSGLTAANDHINGVAPINIANTGTLIVGAVQQTGSGNEGDITIANKGGMTLLEFEPKSAVPVSIFTGGKGNITLKTMSPLTIDGDVMSQSGAIMLEAGNAGVLTIGPTGSVSARAGNIGLAGGSLVNDGSVTTASGNINIAAASVAGSGTFSAPGGTVKGLPVKVPGVGDCLANGALAGCAAVLKDAFNACIVTPTGANCLALLPSLATCSAQPNTPGCSVVLPTLAACGANPDAAGCSVVLQPVKATPDSKLETAVKTTIDALDKSRDDVSLAEEDEKKKKNASADAGVETKPGEKRHDVAKNYCD